MKNLLRFISLLVFTSCAIAGDYLGDFAPGTTAICGQFTTYNASLAPTTLAGTPALSVYKIGDGTNSATESTTGVTHAEDVDSRTGMNRVCIDTSADGTFYSAGGQFSVVITTGTVNSVSVVGSEVKSFSLRKGTISGIPNATAGASGGLQIAGSNAATTYADFDVTANVSLAGGLNITQSTSNTPALVVTGNGTGNGATITSGSGATGAGLAIVAASTNGAGLTTTGTGTGNGATFTSGGGATGNGAQFTAASTNGNGIGLTATGTGTTIPADVTRWAGSVLTTCTGAYPTLGITDCGTAQSGSGTTLQLRSAANFTVDDRIKGANCLITAGTGAGEALNVLSYVNSTDTATMNGTWPTTPDSTSVYVCFGTSPGSSSAPTAGQVATAVWQDATGGDFTVASSIGKSLYTTGATPGATGGLQIAGTNAATTYADLDVTANVSLAGGLNITQSTSNTPALVVTGNGTGNGATITSGSGATGTGLALVAASTNGAAVTATGSGTGNGATFTSGSGATGSGAQFTAASTNGNGIGLIATGTGVTQTISPANVTQIAAQTASAAGAVTFPGTIASPTNITAATGITVATNNDKTGYTLSAAGNTGLLDTSLSGHTTGGTVGGALNSASSAGDPWGTLIPGAYSAGTAGNILGNRLDAAISTRQATLTLPTNFSSLAITGGGAVTVGTNNDKTGYTASTVSDKTGYSLAANAIDSTSIATSGASKISAAVATTQGILTGTCSSGSTTTCVDVALTQAAASQLQDRLICFSDSWCGLITTFNPATDTATTTKVAPSTRASLTYTIFPSTTQ